VSAQVLGSISGKVKSDDNNDDIGDTNLAGVLFTLLDENMDVVAMTVTNSSGNYLFTNRPCV
jgi:SdrD B-like domain